MAIGDTEIYRDASVLLKEISGLEGDNIATVQPDELEKALEQVNKDGTWKETKFRDPAHIKQALKIAIVLRSAKGQILLRTWIIDRDQADAAFKRMHDWIAEEAAKIP